MSNKQLPARAQLCLVFAARYAHTRRTGAALLVVNAIIDNWDRLSADTQKQIINEAVNEATCNLEDWKLITDKRGDE